MDKEIRKVDDVRDDITKIDYEIAELFEKRMGFAAELALSKKQAGESIYNKNKEDEKLSDITKNRSNPFVIKGLEEVFIQMMSISRKFMQQRPIQVLVNALRELGADIEYVANDGFPPLRITGRELRKDTISLPGNVSSQYISALLMIAPVLTNGLTIRLTGDIISRPYINLTLQLMNDFGVRAEWTDDHRLKVEPQAYHSTPFYVESDWSAASYWYQIVALSEEAEVTLPGLFKDSYQGDSQVAGIFRSLGVETIYKDKTVILKKNGKSVERLDYDFINQPDLAQTFVVTCALLNIPFRFSGLQSLKIKETDRMAALITEMRKLGYILHETDGSVLSWEGERCTTEEHPAIDTYEDHRMAMAFAPTCLALPEILINNPQVVSKSYPRYWEDLRQAGFIIKEV